MAARTVGNGVQGTGEDLLAGSIDDSQPWKGIPDARSAAANPLKPCQSVCLAKHVVVLFSIIHISRQELMFQLYGDPPTLCG